MKTVLQKIPVRGELVLHQGQAAYYRVKTQTVSVERFLAWKLCRRKKKPLLAEDVKKPYGKDGDTPFVMEELSIKIEDGVFLPNGALNQLRREALAELQKRDAETLPETGSSAEEGREKNFRRHVRNGENERNLFLQ